MDDESVGAREKAIGFLSDTTTVIEAVTAIIAAASAVVGFVAANGGVISVLGQIGIFAFACYVGAIPAALVCVGLDELAGKMSRQTKDVFAVAVLVIVMLAFALLVRFGLFYDGIGEEGDLDAVGQAFTALVGAAALLLPLGLLWYHRGSTRISGS